MYDNQSVKVSTGAMLAGANMVSHCNTTVAENIDNRVASLQQQIERLQAVKAKLATGSILGVTRQPTKGENNMPKFRKKPVVIEAFQMTKARRADNSEWPQWMHKAWNEPRGAEGSLYPTIEGTGDGTLSCGTLEGQDIVLWNDWIIQNVKGEIYPCTPEIFEATYEAA